MKDKIFLLYMDTLTRYLSAMDGDMPEIQNDEVAQLREDVINDLTSDYSYTTFIEGDLDFSMTPERAADIISFLPEGKNYRIEPTFIKNRDGNWFIAESRLPIRHNNKLLLLNKETNPGALVGIDHYYHDVDYPAAVVIYALYELEEPDLNRLQPMRHPGNCVAKLVRSFFSDSTRGSQLTEARKEAIRNWENNTYKSGGTIEAIKRLETMLQRRIQVLDIMGGKIYPGAKKYYKMGCPIQIYQHNGHAWRDVKFPRRKEVKAYTECPLRSLIKENSVWILDEECSQFLTQEGCLYRPEKEQKKIQEACAILGEDFAEHVLSTRSLNFQVSKKRNGWTTTPKEFKELALSCVEHGHGGLWNMEYNKEDYISLDMKHCYPASFKGLGDCRKYYEQFGHPDGQFFRVSLDGSYPYPDNTTRFIKLTTWKLKENLHPIIYAWYGTHIQEKEWLPIPLLKFFCDHDLLEYTAHEAILCSTSKTQWLPQDNPAARIVIGKFTQGAKMGEKHLQRRLVTDEEELKFLIKRAQAEGTMVTSKEAHFIEDGTPKDKYWILSYYHEFKAQCYHLRASMLSYAHINLLSMLLRFSVGEVPRVATDSLYIHPEVLAKVAPYYTTEEKAESGQWRIKDEQMKTWRDRVHYESDQTEGFSTPRRGLPSIKDPLSYKRLSYLYGMGGSGKTTRVLKLFAHAKVLTHTHRLEREILSGGYDAQTYHSFFHWTGDKWIPQAIKEIPKVILWDEICTVPLDIRKEFIEFLKGKTQIIFCGDPFQPPPITGDMPHEWLKERVDYSEEINTDYRSKEFRLKEFKIDLRGLEDQQQSEVMRDYIPDHSYRDFLNKWHPKDLVLSSKRTMQARIQKDLLKIHRLKYPHLEVPVVYRPYGTRMQKRDIPVPYTDQILKNAVSHDRAWVPISKVEDVISNKNWRLGYCITVHSSQGLTIKDNLWIIDHHLCWSNLIYTAVSRVEKMSQLRRAWGPQIDYDHTSKDIAMQNIHKKLLRYQKLDEEKKRDFDLCADDIYQPHARCAKCNIPLLWSFGPNDDQQFSIDRLNNKLGHTRENIRLTCLECNQSRGYSLL